jgi:hypothetical protein
MSEVQDMKYLIEMRGEWRRQRLSPRPLLWYHVKSFEISSDLTVYHSMCEHAYLTGFL